MSANVPAPEGLAARCSNFGTKNKDQSHGEAEDTSDFVFHKCASWICHMLSLILFICQTLRVSINIWRKYSISQGCVVRCFQIFSPFRCFHQPRYWTGASARCKVTFSLCSSNYFYSNFERTQSTKKTFCLLHQSVYSELITDSVLLECGVL